MRLTAVREERGKPLGGSESAFLLQSGQGERGREGSGLLRPRRLLLFDLMSVGRVGVQFVRGLQRERRFDERERGVRVRRGRRRGVRVVEVSGQTVGGDRLSALGAQHEVTGATERVRAVHVEVPSGQMRQGVIDPEGCEEREGSRGDRGGGRELRGQLFEQERLELAPRTSETQIGFRSGSHSYQRF